MCDFEKNKKGMEFIMKKKNRIQINLWKLIFIISIIVLAIKFINSPSTRNKVTEVFEKIGVERNNKQQHQLLNISNEPEETTTTATLVMVGDNLIHSSIYKDANKLSGGNGYNFKPIIEYIKESIQGYDLAYYNQETILGGTKLGLSDYPTFNSPQEAGDAMLDAGFNLVSLATNHTMDRGEKAVLSSAEYWKQHEDKALAVGSYSSAEERNKVQIRSINGITYAMLNYTYGTNGISIPKGKDYLCNVWPTNLNINDPLKDAEYQEYKKQVKEDIEAVRNQVDVLIVAMHWGVEYTHTPTAYEKDSAKFLADNDVNIVIGTHPHVIQPVEWIDDTIVFYSLGNFVSAQLQNQNYNKMVGLMSSLTITKNVKGDDVNITIDNVKNELIFTSYNSKTWKNFKVVPFSNEHIGEYLSNYQSVYETYKKVVQNLDESMEVVRCYGSNED